MGWVRRSQGKLNLLFTTLYTDCLFSESAKDITPAEWDRQNERLLIQRKWIREQVFRTASSGSPHVFMILPVTDGKPNYRISPPLPDDPASALSPMYISSVAGAPEVVAPIGEVSFRSEVNLRVEPLPMAVSVVGAPGQDLTLLEVVKMAMEHGGCSTKLETGRSIYGTRSRFKPKTKWQLNPRSKSKSESKG